MWKALIIFAIGLSEVYSVPVIGPSLEDVKSKDPFYGPPKPFAFKYGVVDSDSGSSFDHAQQQDHHGVVSGEYRVNLPDGRVQIVTYSASAEKGYVADVRYEGKAIYPDEPVRAKRRSDKDFRKVKNSQLMFLEKQKRHSRYLKEAKYANVNYMPEAPNLYFEV